MFDVDDLLERACTRSGLTNYGDAPLREGLEVFCRALNTEANLTEAGVVSVTAEVLTTLVQRLQIEEHHRLIPDAERQSVVAPIMVTGLPRSGTTALAQMLSKDPALRSIRRWEAEWPSPPIRPQDAASDERVMAMQTMLNQRLEVTPEFQKMLQIAANDPTEHYCYLRFTFQSFHLAGFYNVPSYGEWFLSRRDLAPAYRYMRRVLKLLQVYYPRRRWNLKHPHDLLALDAVADVFPDAHFIWNHRDPARTIPSVASMIYTLRRPTTHPIDKLAIGRLEVERYTEMIARGMAYRRSPNAKSFIDVDNADLVRDAVGTIRKLYDRLGFDYGDTYDAALKARNTSLPKGKYGENKYTLEEFGLNESDLSQRFAAYTASFGVAPG